MQQETSQLELVWRTRAGGGGRTERRYLDFIVDGHSLGDTLDAGDVIGCLGWGVPEYDDDQVQVLLLKQSSPLETGRVMIYVCAECGDSGCGAITARVEKVAECFIWKDFAFEDDVNPLHFKPYRHIGPFRFNKTEYWRVLTQRG